MTELTYLWRLLLWFHRWKCDLPMHHVDPLCVFILQSPRPLYLPPGFRPAQCSDPTCAALRHLCDSCRCHFSIPRLHRSCVCPVLCGRHGCGRCRRLWAVPLCSLTSTNELHDHSRVWLHHAAAARNSCHPRSRGGCCRLQPVSTSAAPDRSHAVKLWITSHRRKVRKAASSHSKGDVTGESNGLYDGRHRQVLMQHPFFQKAWRK